MMKNAAGFTLLELLTTVTIAGILVVISTSFSGVVKNNVISSTVQEFVTALNLARSEAITRSARITMCKSDASVEPRQCVTDGNGSGWNQGWIVFVDVNNDQTVVNPGTNILRVYDTLAANIDFAGSANVQDFISYGSSGFPTNADGTPLARSMITLCDERRVGATARQITIETTGHVSIEPVSSATVCGS